MMSETKKPIIYILTEHTDQEADVLMRQLDELLHPWGEPGAVPDCRDVWVFAPNLDPDPFTGIVVGYDVVCDIPGTPVYRLDERALAGARFRARWTPEVPK